MHRSVINTFGSLAVALALVLTVARAQQKPIDQKDEVLRITTELVQTDVTVVDKQGRFVDGLTAEQFELLVDGKPYDISFFEQVVAGSRREASLRTGASADKHPDNVKSTSSAAPPRRTIFFFVDDMHLSAGSMTYTKAALRRFVNVTMGDKDQVAITTASGQLGFLQQLTTDKAVLTRVIEQLKPKTYDLGDMAGPPMTEHQALAIERNNQAILEVFIEQTCGCRASGMTNNAVLDEVNVRSDRRGSTSGGGGTITSNRVGGGGNINTVRADAERRVRSRARGITRQAAQLVLATLYSLESLARNAEALPERKLLIFVSDGFFIDYVTNNQRFDLRRITDAAVRSGTVIYTFDARGLTSGLNDATKAGMFDRSGRAASLKLSETRDSQQPLINLAAETGGRAWLNSNDLGLGITQAITETSSYYLLAWRPEKSAQSKEWFRNVKVTIKNRPDLIVRTGTGFFSEDPPAQVDPANAVSVDDELMAAIRAPFPKRGIPLILSTGYLNTASDGLVVAASIQIDQKSLPFAGGSDNEIDVMGSLIEGDGSVRTSLKQHLILPAGSTSLVTTLQFSKLPVGLHQVRIAVREAKSGRMGSVSQWIEIPTALQRTFSISTLFLSEGISTTQSSRESTVKPDQTFERTSKLRFRAFVYHADVSTGAPDVQLQLELRRNGQILIQTPPRKLAFDGVSDLSRIPVSGEFPLEGFSAGQYELKLILTDLKAKQTTSQETSFAIR